MSFKNEFVTEDNIEKYQLRTINKKLLIGDFDYEWTRDSEKDIYLRWIRNDREQPKVNQFSFFWKGTLLRIYLTRKGEGERGGKGRTTWSIVQSDGSNTTIWLPEELESKRTEIISDLKDALTVFKDFGMYSTIVDHEAFFEF